MTTPPAFDTLGEYVAGLGDAGFWRPYVLAALERHGLSGGEPVAGIGSTFPTFVCGDVVVKLFGGFPVWRKSHGAESAAHRLLATAAEIAAPRLLAEGELCDGAEAAWPYLITTRMPGVAWGDAKLSFDEKLKVAIDLGRQIARVHALDASRVAVQTDWPAANVAKAARQSSLPRHLVDQINGYIAVLASSDPVFTHGDLMFRHVFVENGRLAGMIDWGDAMPADRHYELAKLHLDLFDCDKALLRAFLEASDWPVAPDFAQRAMAQALLRQARGLAQHPTMDVFYKLPAFFPRRDFSTLDALAAALFSV